MEIIDKEKLQRLVLSCKKRTQMNLQEFLDYFKQVTINLTNEEKAYALFYLMTQNISYDVEGFYSGNRKVDPESVYRRGLGVCSGYARLFECIGTYIGLNIICVSGFAKGYGYKLNDKGYCVDDKRCVQKDEEGKCIKCKDDNLEDERYYCSNSIFGCVQTFLDNCLKCDNLTNLYWCTQCKKGYETNYYGHCVRDYEANFGD